MDEKPKGKITAEKQSRLLRKKASSSKLARNNRKIKAVSTARDNETSVGNQKDNQILATQQDLSLRNELADMPMGDILELKEKLGTKLYRKILFQKTDTPKSDSDDMSDPPETSATGSRTKAKTEFKRKNRKRPREMSAKQPVSMRRDVFSLSKKEKWDPRFHSETGEYSEERFKKNYSFVKDIERNEKEMLKKELAASGNQEEIRKMSDIIQKMENKERSEKEKEKKREKIRNLRRKNIERMKEGKKPVFLKKSELRKQELEEKYSELKRKGKLEKYLRRKNQKQKGDIPRSDRFQSDDS